MSTCSRLSPDTHTHTPSFPLCLLSTVRHGKGRALTEVVRRAQRGEDTGEELQTDLDLCTVAVPATEEAAALARVSF